MIAAHGGPVVMDQLGHADPRMTLSVYARVMLSGDGERDALRALVEGEPSAHAEAALTVQPK